jgi:YVTN family beta-propeller protein
VPVGELPYGVTISRDGRRAYISNHDSDTVSVIDTGNNTVIATITVGEAPERIAITPDGQAIFTANHDDNTVSVIDTNTNVTIQVA